MTQEYRVVDCRNTVIDAADIKVIADTPEHAARLAIGEELVRGSRQVNALRARVYSGTAGALTMVRLYARTGATSRLVDQPATNRWGE